jgi:hypothetical protein
VPAQLEEVVAHPHPLHAQQLGARRGQTLFNRAGWGQVFPRPPRGGVRRRERPPVDLAVGGQRQAVERHDDGWDHRLRQRRREVAPQLGGIDGGIRHDISRQPAVPRHLPGDDHHLAHPGVAAERRLDLPQLDAEAADLHLAVAPPEELQQPVRPPADDVPGAVEAASRQGGERIGNEPLGGQRRPAQVPPRHPLAPREELRPGPHRHRPQAGAEHVDGGPPERPADRHRGGQPLVAEVGGGHHVAGGEGGVLGRAVAVDQRAAGQPLQGPAHGRGRQRVAAGQQPAQGA